MRVHFLLLFFLAVASHLLIAQDVLPLNITHRCVYSGGTMDTELYRFPDSEKVVAWVKEICELGGATLDFQVVQTNVENASAVLDSQQRYLLYSLDFVEKSTPLEVFGALAHEIGHHANAHSLNAERLSIEEIEADQFMGYVLSKKGFPKPDIEAFLKKMPSSYAVTFEERRATAWQGFERADHALQIKRLPFLNDPTFMKFSQTQAGMPYFPWPPPSCNARYELPETSLAGLKTLGDVERKIRLALDATGYAQRSYFSVPSGFALVTQLEQYNGEDGSVRNDRTRWLDYPKKDNFDGVMSYLKSVVMPQKGHFRIFVFVTTNQPFGGSAQHISREQATAWLGQGFNKLPSSRAAAPLLAGYGVTALVYEFVVPESNRKPEQTCPSPLFDAKTHLIKAGLAAALGF